MICGEAEYDLRDREFNALYQLIMRHADSAQKTAIKKAQQAWVVSKEATCALYQAESSFDARTLAQACYLNHTVTRIHFLSFYAKYMGLLPLK